LRFRKGLSGSDFALNTDPTGHLPQQSRRGEDQRKDSCDAPTRPRLHLTEDLCHQSGGVAGHTRPEKHAPSVRSTHRHLTRRTAPTSTARPRATPCQLAPPRPAAHDVPAKHAERCATPAARANHPCTPAGAAALPAPSAATPPRATAASPRRMMALHHHVLLIVGGFYSEVVLQKREAEGERAQCVLNTS